eukprot:6304113-Prymnesium_polylepis.1
MSQVSRTAHRPRSFGLSAFYRLHVPVQMRRSRRRLDPEAVGSQLSSQTECCNQSRTNPPIPSPAACTGASQTQRLQGQEMPRAHTYTHAAVAAN